MFKFIQSRLFLQLVALLGVVAFAVYQFVTAAHFVSPASDQLWWTSLLPLQNHSIAMGLIVAFGILVQITLADVYFFRGGFGDTHHLMVLFWYLLILVCGSFVADFSPVWMTNIVLALIVAINFDYDSGNVKNKDLISGILLGIASLFYLPMLIISFFVVFSLLINKYSKTKDIIAFVIGLLVVCIYVFCYYFLTNQWSLLLQMLSKVKFYNTFSVTTVYSWREIVLLSALVVSLLYSLLVLKIHYDGKQILLRKRLITIHLITVSTLLLMVFSPFDIHYSIGFMVLPMSLYYAMISQLKNHRIVNDVMMLVFVVALCL